MSGPLIFWESVLLVFAIVMIMVLKREGACQGGIFGRLWGHKFGYRDSDLEWNRLDNCRRCGKHKDGPNTAALEKRIHELEKWSGKP